MIYQILKVILVLIVMIDDASSYLVTCKSNKTVMKPVVVCDYNNTMGGVDLCDQEMSYYPTLQIQQGKYYIKIFRQFLDQSLWNAYILYKKQNPTQNIKLLEFRLQMVEESIQKYSDGDKSSCPGRPSSTPNPLRLTARHFARHIPPNPIKREPRRQCAVCCSRKDANGKKIAKKHESGAKTVKLDFALNPVSNSIILNYISKNGMLGDKIIDNMVSIAPTENWKRIRTIITPAFTSGKMRKMASIINNSSETLLQNFLQAARIGANIDVKSLFGTFSMDVIVSSAFGVKLQSHNDPNNAYAVHAREFFSPDTTWRVLLFILTPFLMKLFKISVFSPKGTHFFRDATLEIVKHRREKGEVRNDFLQLLMDAANEDPVKENPNEDPKLKNDYGHEEGNDKIFSQKLKNKTLTNDELVAQCVLFFFAAYDTTATTLSFVAYNLALNPNVQERLIKEVDETTKDKKQLDFDLVNEMKYLDQVITETLRLYPVAHKIERVASEDYKLGDTGITVPKGMLISFPVYAIHRDPEHYPNPEKFDPDRFTPENKAKRHPFSYVPFGAGPRNCIGMRFALMEIKLCLVYLLQYIRFRKCLKTEVPLQFHKWQFLMQPKSLTLAVEPRKDGKTN